MRVEREELDDRRPDPGAVWRGPGLEPVERRIADLGPRDGGATLVVVAGLHGNEPAGVEASLRVARRLEQRRDALVGRAVFLVGNRAALARGLRFVDRDLNRAWTPGRVDALGRHGLPPNAEDGEQRGLLAELDALLAQTDGPLHVLDVHTTSGDGGPFTTVADTLPNRALALALPVPLVLGLEELVEGTLHDWLGRRGCVSVAFEAGQHREHAAVDRAEAGIWILLTAAGVLPPSAIPELRGARELLAAAARGLPRVLEMRRRHAVTPDDGFRMKPGYRSFQVVRRGEILATDRTGEIRAPESARILMPLYQVQGEDGFFVVREVRPFWLRISAALRRVGAARLVHWLPGIARDPARPGALVVDRSVARWHALELLHLLGFRRHEEDGERLVVLRQDASHDEVG